MGNENDLVAGMSYGTITDMLQKMKEYAAKIGGRLGYKEASICIFDKNGKLTTNTFQIHMLSCKGRRNLNEGLPEAGMYIFMDFKNNVSSRAYSDGKINRITLDHGNVRANDNNGDGIIQEDEIERRLDTLY